jgi:hypothetical protein
VPTVIAQAEKALEWASEAEVQEPLKQMIAGWFTQNQDPERDQQREAIIRTIYTLIARKVKNPNRRTRRPFFTYEELKQAIIRDNKLPEVTFEVLWKEPFEEILQQVQTLLRDLPRQTQPRR